MSAIVFAKLAGAVIAVGAIGWGYYAYIQAEDFAEKLAFAEKRYSSCVAERKRLRQADFVCRHWSYANASALSSGNNKKRLLEICLSYAISGAANCHRELEYRREQLRQLENELRGRDGLFHFRSDADRHRFVELRRLIETIGIDCKSLDDTVENRAC